MNITIRIGIVLIVLAALIGGAASPPASASAPLAYVEPALLAATTETVSVIVAADDSQTAAHAIDRVGGQVTSDLWLIDSAAATLPTSQVKALAAAPGIQSIVVNKGVKTSDRDGWVTDLDLPDHWDGRPDVQSTNNKRVWKLVNPVAIDVGADVVHQTRLASGQPIKGTGVTVAVVDSGVYFDKEVKKDLGNAVQKLFLGQIDFVDSVCRTMTQGHSATVIGTQYNSYCALTAKDSADGYGHGTAVASIIWNNFTDYATGVTIGIAPDANVLSIRVLDNEGYGSYETVISGIQYAVQNKAAYNIRVLNLSLSAQATTPYFVDPLNRAAERAWANGIVVLAAAGNDGPTAETISVPGNDPYVITVGAINNNRTPGYWADDFLPEWSATGPTGDGFVKPDLLAPGSNIITFMYNDPNNIANSQKLVRIHPDYSATTSLFRMNGTSMSTAIASGIVALILQAHSELTPDQVKFRVIDSARLALTRDQQDLVYTFLHQGMGRIWARDAVLGAFAADGDGNPGMDILADLAHGYETDADLAYHYQGPIRKILSEDGQAYLYYLEGSDGSAIGLGAASANGMSWIDRDTLASGRMAWAGGRMAWAGGISLAAGRMAWAGGRMAWAGGRMAWAGGRMAWAGGLVWTGSTHTSASGRMAWAGSVNSSIANVSTTRWVEDQ